MVSLASILFVAAGFIWPALVIGQPLSDASRVGNASWRTRSIDAIGFAWVWPTPDAIAFGDRACPLDLPSALLPLVEQMWRSSPTFRRQCLRLTDAAASVVVWLDPRLNGGPARAVTSIAAPDGVVRAHMRLGTVEAEYL